MQQQTEFLKEELPQISSKLVDLIINGSFVNNQYMVYNKTNDKLLPDCDLCAEDKLTAQHLFMSDMLGELINFKLKSFKLENLHTLLVLSCTHVNYHPVTEFICENISSLFININAKDTYYKVLALQVAAKYDNIPALLSIISLESLDCTFESLYGTFNACSQLNTLERLFKQAYDQLIADMQHPTKTNELIAKSDALAHILNTSLKITRVAVNSTINDNETNNQTPIIKGSYNFAAYLDNYYIPALKLLSEINSVVTKQLGMIRCVQKSSYKSANSLLNYKKYLIDTYDDLELGLKQNIQSVQDQINRFEEEELQVSNEVYDEKDQDNIQLIPKNNLENDINQEVISEAVLDVNNIEDIEFDTFINNNKLELDEGNQIDTNIHKLDCIKYLKKSQTILEDLLHNPGKANSIEFHRALKYAQKGAFNINESKKSKTKQSVVIKIDDKPITSYHEPHNGKGINPKVIRIVKQNVSDYLEESKNNNQLSFFGVNNNNTSKQKLNHNRKSNFKK